MCAKQIILGNIPWPPRDINEHYRQFIPWPPRDINEHYRQFIPWPPRDINEHYRQFIPWPPRDINEHYRQVIPWPPRDINEHYRQFIPWPPRDINEHYRQFIPWPPRDINEHYRQFIPWPPRDINEHYRQFIPWPPRDINEHYRQFIDELTTVLAKLERYHNDVTVVGEYKISHRLLKTSAGITLSKISDRIPCFVSLDYVNIKLKNITKCIQVKQQNASNLNNFKEEIPRTNRLTNFNLSIDADPNRNYDILEHTIMSAINEHLPNKTVKFNKHKHKNSNWITKGIIKSIKYRDTLYRTLKKTNPYSQQPEVMVINLHT